MHCFPSHQLYSLSVQREVTWFGKSKGAAPSYEQIQVMRVCVGMGVCVGMCVCVGICVYALMCPNQSNLGSFMQFILISFASIRRAPKITRVWGFLLRK